MYSVTVLEDWGSHKKGARIKLEGTTARACEKHGKVKIDKSKKAKDVTGKTNKKESE